MDTTGTVASRDDAGRHVASRMAAAALAWLDALSPAQRAVAAGAAPSAEHSAITFSPSWFAARLRATLPQP